MRQKGFAPIAIVLMVVFLAVGGYFFYNNYSNNQIKPSQPEVNSYSSPTPVKESTNSVSEAPSTGDWISKKSSYCDVTLNYPPNKEPYFEYLGDSNIAQNKRFWQLRENSGSSGDGNWMFHSGSSLIYVADVEASGYIAGLVRVQCEPYTAHFTQNNIAETYALGFGENAGIKVKSKRTTKIWGKEVVAAKFEGGMFVDNEIYFVLTDKNVYKIEKRSDSDKEFVKNTTDQIFTNLSFND